MRRKEPRRIRIRPLRWRHRHAGLVRWAYRASATPSCAKARIVAGSRDWGHARIAANCSGSSAADPTPSDSSSDSSPSPPASSPAVATPRSCACFQGGRRSAPLISPRRPPYKRRHKHAHLFKVGRRRTEILVRVQSREQSSQHLVRVRHQSRLWVKQRVGPVRAAKTLVLAFFRLCEIPPSRGRGAITSTRGTENATHWRYHSILSISFNLGLRAGSTVNMANTN